MMIMPGLLQVVWERIAAKACLPTARLSGPQYPNVRCSRHLMMRAPPHSTCLQKAVIHSTCHSMAVMAALQFELRAISKRERQRPAGLQSVVTAAHLQSMKRPPPKAEMHLDRTADDRGYLRRRQTVPCEEVRGALTEWILHWAGC